MSDDNTQNNVEAEISDADLDKIMQDIETEVEEPAPRQETKPEAKVERFPVVNGGKSSNVASLQTPAKAQSLALELTGTINLKLTFSNGTRSVEVFCTDESLICRMADGTEFKIPTGEATTKRKTA